MKKHEEDNPFNSKRNICSNSSSHEKNWKDICIQIEEEHSIKICPYDTNINYFLRLKQKTVFNKWHKKLIWVEWINIDQLWWYMIFLNLI